MPKRVIDGEALWTSKKLKNLGATDCLATLLYCWLLPLADHQGVFEYDLDLIWKDALFYLDIMTPTELADYLSLYVKGGLLLVFESNSKKWGYWVGMEKSGRLPGAEHSKRYKKTEYDLSDMSRTTAGYVPDISARGIGIGIGSGIGVGIGSGAENPAPAPSDEKEEVVTKSTVQAIEDTCRKVFGYDPKSGEVRASLKSLVGTYGDSAIVDAFQDWAESCQGSPMNYPLTTFSRVAIGIINGSTVVKVDDTMQNLLDEIGEIAGNDIVFSKNQTVALRQMLIEYGHDDFLAAFKDFHSKQDEFMLKRAAASWIATGFQYIRNIVLARQQQKMREQVADQLTEQGRREALAGLAEAQKAEVDPDGSFDPESF